MRHVIILRDDGTRRTANRTSDWVGPTAGMFQTTVCGPYLAPIDFHPLDPLNHVVGKLLASDTDVKEAVTSCLHAFDIRSYAPRHKSWCHSGTGAF